MSLLASSLPGRSTRPLAWSTNAATPSWAEGLAACGAYQFSPGIDTRGSRCSRSDSQGRI
jgi:hypothetical protein